jgi:hypothetical protein
MSGNTYGPVRRAAGMLGLLALAPTALGLLSGTLTARDAAVRAAVTMIAAIAVARLASWWLRSALDHPEPEPGGDEPGPPGAGAAAGPTPRRRSTDDPPGLG